MRKLYFVGCVIAAVACLGGCTKTNDIEPVSKGVDFFAHVDNVDTKTSIDDSLHVLWEKDDQIAIQVTKNHLDNASRPREYATTLGIYKLADDAAGTNVGRFTFEKGNEHIEGDEEFFAFYPASYCTANKSNGYFYVDFPMTQYYEDNIGDKLPLPMYGIGSNRNVDFKYAGAVIKLRVWAEKKDSIHSCVISADNLSKKAFTYVKDGKWQGLSNSHDVNNLNMNMRKPLEISNDEGNPTVITMIIPLAGTKTLTNLKFSVNCESGGSELKKKSGLKVTPGTVVTFPVTKLTIVPDRMFVDGLEGEIDTEWVKTAKDSVRVTMVPASKLSKVDFHDIMEATRNLHDENKKIVLDLSRANAKESTLEGLNNDNKYVGFCGGSNRDNGINNISKFYLPEGITTILNRAFAYSGYTEIVLPTTLTKISGSPSNGCDSLVWKVADGNKSFQADEKGALYDYGMKTLMVLNGGSGGSYIVKDGTTTIREWALYENSVIKSLTLPASVTKLSADCISGTPNLTTIKCLGTVPAEFKPNTGKNKVGPANQTKTLYVPKGCVEIYTDKWAALLKEENWEVKELQN